MTWGNRFISSSSSGWTVGMALSFSHRERACGAGWHYGICALSAVALRIMRNLLSLSFRLEKLMRPHLSYTTETEVTTKKALELKTKLKVTCVIQFTITRYLMYCRALITRRYGHREKAAPDDTIANLQKEWRAAPNDVSSVFQSQFGAAEAGFRWFLHLTSRKKNGIIW